MLSQISMSSVIAKIHSSSSFVSSSVVFFVFVSLVLVDSFSMFWPERQGAKEKSEYQVSCKYRLVKSTRCLYVCIACS